MWAPEIQLTANGLRKLGKDIDLLILHMQKCTTKH